MKTEENKRMLAISYIVADLKAENIELAQRVQQLVDDYNDVVRQLDGKETHKDEDPSQQTLDAMMQMRDHCDKLEKENRELERFVRALYSFVKDNSIYMRKGASCAYKQGNPAVCSASCLECNACLGVIEGHGVICEERLKEESVTYPSSE